MSHSSRRIEIVLSTALAAGVVFSSLAAAQDVSLPDISLVEIETVSDIPTPQVGEIREFTGSVASVNCSRWEVIASDSADHLVSQCGSNKIYLKKADHLNLHKVTGVGGENTLVFEPSYPGIEFPLQVGKKWRRPYTGFAAIEGLRWEGDLGCEVADYTEVEVVAGKFKAYRIECHDNWTVGTTGSSVNSTTWYSPEIAGVVKTITYEDPRWNSELKAFSR